MKHVFEYLKKSFDLDVINQQFDSNVAESVEKFLKELEENSNDHNVLRLAVCIAIDIKSGNVTVNTYSNVIGGINWDINNMITERFHEASKNSNFYKTNFPDSTCEIIDTQYVRVMTLMNYESRYIPKTKYSVLKLNNNSNVPIENMHINTNKSIPFTDKDKDKTMRGGKECGWILRQDQLNTITSNDPFSDWADDFVDKAGFHIGNPTASKLRQYLYLVYPNDFREEVYKPSAIHADWQGIAPYPYISGNKVKGWGYTFNMSPVSNQKDAFDERIHLPFHLYTSSANQKQYGIKAYGVSSLSKNHEYYPLYLTRAIDEGLRRFEQL